MYDGNETVVMREPNFNVLLQYIHIFLLDIPSEVRWPFGGFEKTFSARVQVDTYNVASLLQTLSLS